MKDTPGYIVSIASGLMLVAGCFFIVRALTINADNVFSQRDALVAIALFLLALVLHRYSETE